LIVDRLNSPCCAPLWVAGALALLAGPPLAIIVAQHGGWDYTGLTLLSIVSVGLGLR
jgi:hypothetical protein